MVVFSRTYNGLQIIQFVLLVCAFALTITDYCVYVKLNGPYISHHVVQNAIMLSIALCYALGYMYIVQAAWKLQYGLMHGLYLMYTLLITAVTLHKFIIYQTLNPIAVTILVIIITIQGLSHISVEIFRKDNKPQPVMINELEDVIM